MKFLFTYKSILIVMLLLFCSVGFSQEKGTVVVRKNQDSIIDLEDYDIDLGEETICLFPIEKMPEFPGGEEKLYEYLKKSIKYPDSAKMSDIKGNVYIGFVVEKDGSISNIQLLRGIGYGCDEVALKAIKEMPNWIPGEQRGKKVRVKYTLPIRFQTK